MRPRGLEDVVQPPETQASGLFGIGLHTSEVDLDAGLVADHPGVDELGHGDEHDNDPVSGARRPLPPARDGRAAERRPTSVYLMPITIESGPIRCSARVSANPASSIQPMQSAAV